MHKVGKRYAPFKTQGTGQRRNNSELDFSWTTLVSLILTSFTAVAFGAGQAYREAYLQSFNFDTQLIPLSFPDTVYWGIVKPIGIILIAPFWFLFVIVLPLGLIKFFFEFSKLNKKKYSPQMGYVE